MTTPRAAGEKNAKWRKVSGCLFLCLFSVPATHVHAQTPPAADAMALTGDPVPAAPTQPKPDYSLFDPAPDGQMRPLSTDRPGKTHSSITVDAGHFQVESDFLNYTYDHYSPGEQTTRILSVATPILKAGITNSVDLEAAFDFYNDTHVTSRGGTATATGTSSSGSTPGGSNGTQTGGVGSSSSSTGASSIGKGFGDVALGAKVNVFGNDGGAQSFALLPFVKIPTAGRNVGNRVVEYTLNAPYTINLDTLWSLTAEPAFGYLKNADNTGHHGDYSFLVNLNRPVFVKSVTAALEVASEYSSRDFTPRYTLDPSLQWLVTGNLQLDMGVYLGLNKAAPDYNPYVGISYRY